MTGLMDDYSTGKVNRRTFMKKLALVTGGTAAAVIIIPELNNASARRQKRSR